MNLFRFGSFTSHSGQKLDWKIECDAFTQDDWECIAYIIARRFVFGDVYGIPNGGVPLEKALMKYRIPDSPTRLVVDDVWTTGNSMLSAMKEDDIGVVVFARGPIDQTNLDVYALWEMGI
jgi:hypothetical protein